MCMRFMGEMPGRGKHEGEREIGHVALSPAVSSFWEEEYSLFSKPTSIWNALMMDSLRFLNWRDKKMPLFDYRRAAYICRARQHDTCTHTHQPLLLYLLIKWGSRKNIVKANSPTRRGVLSLTSSVLYMFSPFPRNNKPLFCNTHPDATFITAGPMNRIEVPLIVWAKWCPLLPFKSPFSSLLRRFTSTQVFYFPQTW